MPCGSAASVMHLVSEVQNTDSEFQLSFTALDAAILQPAARSVDEASAVGQRAVDSRRLAISGSHVLIGFLVVLCLVELFVVGIVRFWLFAR